MRLLSLYSNHNSSVAFGATCLVFFLAITGCASKNPLIDEPVAASKSPAPATTRTEHPASPQTAETKPATSPVASGVQTSKKRRFLGIFSPYRINIQQGNFVSREMVAQLKEGMTPDQVRFVLGTPLLTDVFHANRWDYPFRLIEGNGEITSSQVTVYFKDNRLSRIEGGDLPTEKDFLALIADEPGDKSATARPMSRAPAPQPASGPAPTDPVNRRR